MIAAYSAVLCWHPILSANGYSPLPFMISLSRNLKKLFVLPLTFLLLHPIAQHIRGIYRMMKMLKQESTTFKVSMVSHPWLHDTEMATDKC